MQHKEDGKTIEAPREGAPLPPLAALRRNLKARCDFLMAGHPETALTPVPSGPVADRLRADILRAIYEAIPEEAEAPPGSEDRQHIARPLSEWHEDIGPVLWWCFPVEEAPYVGSPLDLGRTVEVHTSEGVVSRFMVGGWPGYHTHWTPLPPTPSPAEARHDPSASCREEARAAGQPYPKSSCLACGSVLVAGWKCPRGKGAAA